MKMTTITLHPVIYYSFFIQSSALCLLKPCHWFQYTKSALSEPTKKRPITGRFFVIYSLWM